MPIVHSVQTVQLFCTDTKIISKWTKTRFHTTHIMYEFHQVHPKLFMNLWYIQCKPCTCLVSRLALSPNGPNIAPPDPRHLGDHRVRLKRFMSLWYFWHKLSTYLAPTLTLSQTDRNEIPHDTCHLGVLSGASNTISKPMVRSTQTVHQSCIKSSAISKRTEPCFRLSLLN
jgi:hypothetical protein